MYTPLIFKDQLLDLYIALLAIKSGNRLIDIDWFNVQNVFIDKICDN